MRNLENGGFEGLECVNVKKLKMSEPFWGLGGLIMYEDVDGKGSGGFGWVSPMCAGRTGDTGCRFGTALWGGNSSSQSSGSKKRKKVPFRFHVYACE
jgi:hypothetical protein